MQGRIKLLLDIKSMTFKKKLIVAFMCISIIPVLFVGFLSLSVSDNVVINLKSEMVVKEFANDVEKISSILKDIDDVSISLFSNEYIQSSLNNPHPSDDMVVAGFYNNVSGICSSILNSKKYISSINIFGKNGLQYSSQAYTTDAYNDYKTCRSYLDKNDVKGLNIWYGSERFRIFNGISYNIMNIKIIRNINTLEESGIIILSIDEKYLRSIYNDKNSSLFIIDNQGNIISDVDEKRINQSVSGEEYFLKINKATKNSDSILQNIDGEKVLISYAKIKGVNWFLVNIIKYSDILSASSRIRIFTIMIILICIIVSFIAAFAISKGLTATMLELKGLMNEVEKGKLDVEFHKKNNDEINFLGESFNHMLKNINESIDQIKLKEKLKRNSDLKLMQAQINPHMLYNTLDSMQWCLADGDMERARKINIALSTFFKISLSKGNILIPVAQELDHVKSYIDIQNICFKKEFKIQNNISEPFYDCCIIKLTLQPLVENCIVHGFKNYKDDGNIKIFAVDNAEGYIEIIVEDDGMGMTDEQVARLNSYMRDEKSADVNKPFGMKNVNDRIMHFFGSPYGITIESEFGAFTRITVKIPRIENDTAAFTEVLTNV